MTTSPTTGSARRNDGRVPNQLRPVKIVPDYLKFAEGSVLIRVGDTRVQDPYCLRCQPQVMGAALDVLENEKLNELTPAQSEGFRNLITGGNVIFTPHIAGWTFESHIKINVALVEKIKTLDLS
mgnify:CR=1 FL=1